MKLKSFDSYLFSQLQDPEFAILYLSEAYTDSTEEFLVALNKYVEANGGVEQAAAAVGISREMLAALSDSSSSEQGLLLLQSVVLGFRLGEMKRKTPAGLKQSIPAKSRRKLRSFS